MEELMKPKRVVSFEIAPVKSCLKKCPRQSGPTSVPASAVMTVPKSGSTESADTLEAIARSETLTFGQSVDTDDECSRNKNQHRTMSAESATREVSASTSVSTSTETDVLVGMPIESIDETDTESPTRSVVSASLSDTNDESDHLSTVHKEPYLPFNLHERLRTDSQSSALSALTSEDIEEVPFTRPSSMRTLSQSSALSALTSYLEEVPFTRSSSIRTISSVLSSTDSLDTTTAPVALPVGPPSGVKRKTVQFNLSPRGVEADFSPRKHAIHSTKAVSPKTGYGHFFRRMRRRWETLGLVLLIFSAMNMLGFFSGPFIHILCDVYFMCDPFVRYHSGYIDVDGNLKVREEVFSSQYTRFWFIYDIVCAVPVGSLYYVWENRPGIHLLEMAGESNPFFKFASNRFFRKEMLGLLRGHLSERHVIKTVVHFITNRHTSLATTSKPLLRKLVKYIGFVHRSMNKYNRVRNVINTAHLISGAFVMTRALSVLLSVRRIK